MAPRLWLVSFGKSKCDELFDIQANTLIDFCTLQGHASGVTRVAFSPNGKLLALASLDRTVSLWSVEERKRKHILESPGSDQMITFLLDSTLVAWVEAWTKNLRSGFVRVWDTGTGKVKNNMEFPLGKRPYTKLDCSPDGGFVAAALGNGGIELWDTEKRAIKHVFPPVKATLYEIKVSSNGEVVAVAHSDGCTILRNTGKGFQERMFSGVPWSTQEVYFSPNSQIMALVSHNGILLIGNEAWFGDKHGQASRRISGSSLDTDRIAFSWDSKLAALVGRGSEIRLESTVQGEEMRVLKGHSDRVTSVVFSPISPLLASTSGDHTVILWDTEKGEKLCTLIARSDNVRDVAFSPNGELVVTVSADGIVGLWNVSRWKNGKDQEQSS